jgi:hypothetical protein
MDDILMIDWNKQLDVWMDYKSSWSTCELWNIQSTRIGDLLETVVVCFFSPQIWKMYWTFIHMFTMTYIHVYIYIYKMFYLITYNYTYIKKRTMEVVFFLRPIASDLPTLTFSTARTVVTRLWRRCDAVPASKAHLPAAYVNPRDPFVRLPQTPQTPTPRGDSLRVICCGDLHALRHEIQALGIQPMSPGLAKGKS